MFKQLMQEKYAVPEGGLSLFRDLNLEECMKKIPAGIRTIVTEKAERWLNYEFPVIPFTRFMETRRFGNRYNYETYLVDRWAALFDLICAELLYKEGRYIDKIMDCVWMDCEMSTWTIPSHVSYVLPTVEGANYDHLELFSAEMGAIISLAYYFFKDEFESRAPKVFNARIIYELRRRMIDSFMNNSDGFAWFKRGGNWNIWIMSNLLIAGACIITDSNEMTALVQKVLSSAQVYLDTFPKDAICPEGSRYWMLSCGTFIDCIELLYDITEGRVDLTGEPILRKMLEYNMYFVKPGTYHFNFGDCEIGLPADAIFLRRVAKRIGYDEMERYAAGLYVNDQKSYLNNTSNQYRRLRDFFCSGITREAYTPYEPPYPHHMESLHTYFGCEGDMNYAIKAHTNGDPHGHLDTGSIIIFKEGKPLLIDPGLDAYSSFNWSFEKTKYRNAAWHNTMIFNGYAEAPGPGAKATDHLCGENSYSFELAGTFKPEAEVKSWRRTCRNRDGAIYLEDRWEIGGEGSVSLVLMIWDKPRIITEEHKICLDRVGAFITYDPIFTPEVDLLEENGSLNCEAVHIEHAMRVDFYKIAPRLHYEMPLIMPYASSLQWGQPYLYRIRLNTKAHSGCCVTEIK